MDIFEKDIEGYGTDFYLSKPDGYKKMLYIDLDGQVLSEAKNYKLIAGPSLPEIKFKIKNKYYTVTDIRYLNQQAVDIIDKLIQSAAKSDEKDYVAFNTNGVNADDIQIIVDIVMGLNIHVSTVGRGGGWASMTFLVSECRRAGDILLFRYGIDRHKYIHEYFKKTKKKSIEYKELAVMIAEKVHGDDKK